MSDGVSFSERHAVPITAKVGSRTVCGVALHSPVPFPVARRPHPPPLPAVLWAMPPAPPSHSLPAPASSSPADLCSQPNALKPSPRLPFHWRNSSLLIGQHCLSVECYSFSCCCVRDHIHCAGSNSSSLVPAAAILSVSKWSPRLISLGLLITTGVMFPSGVCICPIKVPQQYVLLK